MYILQVCIYIYIFGQVRWSQDHPELDPCLYLFDLYSFISYSLILSYCYLNKVWIALEQNFVIWTTPSKNPCLQKNQNNSTYQKNKIKKWMMTFYFTQIQMHVSILTIPHLTPIKLFQNNPMCSIWIQITISWKNHSSSSKFTLKPTTIKRLTNSNLSTFKRSQQFTITTTRRHVTKKRKRKRKERCSP